MILSRASRSLPCGCSRIEEDERRAALVGDRLDSGERPPLQQVNECARSTAVTTLLWWPRSRARTCASPSAGHQQRSKWLQAERGDPGRWLSWAAESSPPAGRNSWSGRRLRFFTLPVPLSRNWALCCCSFCRWPSGESLLYSIAFGSPIARPIAWKVSLRAPLLLIDFCHLRAWWPIYFLKASKKKPVPELDSMLWFFILQKHDISF